MNDKTPRLYLIDGYALIYRSYYAFISNPLTNSKGENTSAEWGVANFLITILEEHKPEYLAVVFDAGRSHRETLFPEYKATREKMPDDLRDSLPRIRALVEAFHGPVVALEGYEADDVIGTLTRRGQERRLEVVIVSGDKDFYQLLEPGVALLNPGRGGPQGVAAERVEHDAVAAKFGVPADQVIDYLALIGDSSDNVPGATGVGPKTATKLLAEFGSLDALLEQAAEIKGKRAREALQNEADQIRLSKELVTIMTDVPIDIELEDLEVRQPDHERLRELLLELEFRTLVERLDLGAGFEGAGAAVQTQVVESVDDMAPMIAAAREAGSMAVVALSGGERAVAGRLAGVGVAVAPTGDDSEHGSNWRAWYLPLSHTAPGELMLDLMATDDIKVLPALDSDAMRPFRDLMADPDITMVGHDLKEVLIAFGAAGVPLEGPRFDVMVASYVLDPGRRQQDLESLASDFLGLEVPARKTVVGTGQSRVSMHEVGVADAGEFAAVRAATAARLADVFDPRLDEEGLHGLMDRIETPLVPVLAAMESRGIGIDSGFFRTMSSKLGKQLSELQAAIHDVAGREFNLNSTPQLRQVLFDDLGLPVLKRTKTGPSTDVSVLEELAAAGHELPTMLIEYRQLEKLRGTYVDALPRLVHPRTGRIHTSFNQAVAATGRLSSSDPNLQNIPIRTDLGREVRRGFVAKEGCTFLGVDYSQIELRILAHFSGDAAFVDAFTEGVDVHKQTASVIFEVPIDEVTSDMRGQAKTINFATIYGQGDFSLAKQLGISRTEAREFIDGYFERFAGVRDYLDEQIRLATEQGYVETLLGRRRYVPELQAKNWNVKQFGQRVAQNTPIQGTAADMIKLAMIEVERALEDSELDGLLLLQVHDELLLEVPTDQLDATRDLVVELMEGAMELAVPLVAEAGSGKSWYDCKG